MSKQKQLKDGDHVWEDWGRGYFFKGKTYPGISSILSKTMPESKKKSLADWRKRVGYEAAETICEQTRSSGTRWHNFLDYFSDKDYIGAQRILFADDAVKDFYAQSKNFLLKFAHITENVLTELPVYSDNHKYAGTFDCLVTANNERVLLDWKTSIKPKRKEWITDYFLQLAAYAHAIEETERIIVDRATVVIFYSFQEPDIFKLNKNDLAEQFELFKERLKLFYELFPSTDTDNTKDFN